MNGTNPTARLIYVHDPMCSWCWAFRPACEQLQAGLPAAVAFERLLGGLAADDDAPMAEAMREHLRRTWRRIQERVPGTHFNFDFWERCRPRRSTWPACRAVIAARAQAPAREDDMILAIQRAYYLDARNPSEASTLVELAGALGLDAARFSSDLGAPATARVLQEEIATARGLGVDSFPSLVLEYGASRWPIPVDYRDARPMLGLIETLLA
ncbi:MAG: DsbA family protein [Gammaproteobacteria bacterium]